jgi:diguanylate cyclase (GGDEF)-like protein
VRAVAASVGLVSSSAIFVHLSGGYIEAHFHFFVMIGIMALYQEWRPFLVAIAYVVVHHGLMGLIDPTSVFNHPDAQANPLMWAGVHGAFVLAASFVSIVGWRFVEHQSLHDPLTDLPNRELFTDRLNHALAISGRTGRGLAVIYLDVDDFKGVNDRFGHVVGDELLRTLARRLSGTLRSVDTASRLGGDEFAILIEDVASVDEVARIGQKVRQRIAEPYEILNERVAVTASLGIAMASAGTADDAIELVRQADVGMYRAKANGKGGVEIFDEAMDRAVRQRLELEIDLRRAIDRREFRTYYQPIVDLASQRITGLEALVRWQHPKRGLLLPAEFVPLAEATGVIVAIDRLVLEAACQDVAIWQRADPAHANLEISINLSAHQFRTPDFKDVAGRILTATGLHPATLKLEITESVAMLDGPRTQSVIADLRALGIRFVIDDFGVGFAGLDYARRFSVDGLKLDRSFVAGVGQSREDTAIVAATTAFAAALDLTVTAEGIETHEQAAALLRLGCDRGQGFLYSRAVAATEIEAMLLADRVRQVAAAGRPRPLAASRRAPANSARAISDRPLLKRAAG